MFDTMFDPNLVLLTEAYGCVLDHIGIVPNKEGRASHPRFAKVISLGQCVVHFQGPALIGALDHLTS